MKRRILLLLTAVCLVFSAAVGSSRMVSAETTFTAPHLGDEVQGFTVKDSRYDQATKSTKILLEHNNTGAKLLVIKNRDINRGFSIKFNTPPDNRGTNHILEHSVLGGSKKYPTKNTIFDIMNTTYVSFANAFTYPNMTMYPITSQSEDQLFKSADIYLDAVFNPLILSDQRVFEREGWRYELADESSNIIYNGIVYNEMQGSMGNITSTAISNGNKTIFPDTDQGNNSGGIPSEILTLSYEDLIDTYEKYYHPSNSFMVLYGDVDYEKFLDMVDKNYLSAYTKKTIDIKRNPQKPFDKLVEKTYSFPVANETNTKKSSIIDLVFAAEDIKKLGMENYMGLNLGVSLLNLDSSDIKKAMLESQIAESYMIQLDISTYQPTIHFIAMNADSDSSKEFYNLVMKELEKVVNNGMNTDLVNSLLRSMEFDEIIGSGDGLNEMVLSSLFDNLMNDPMDNYMGYIKNVSDKLDQNILEKIIKKQILDNKLVALTVTKPEVGLLEKNQVAITEKLSKLQSNMTEEEIKALVNKTLELNIWNNEGTPDDVLKSLRAVDLKDISIEIKDREIIEENVDGVKLWSSKADVDGISSIQFNFDLSHLTQEELLYLKFYNEMISYGMGTKNRSDMEVMNDVTNLLYNISTSVIAYPDNKEDTSSHPVFTLNYYSFEDEYSDTFELVYDILLQSDIENISTYGKRAIANIKANYEMQLAEPIALAQYRSMAYTSAVYRMYNYLNGLDYYNFILSLEKDIASNPTDVFNKLMVIRAKAFTYNKNNMLVLFAGDGNALDKFKTAMPSF
ncbi:MAG: hypothetical protein GX915_05395, partial [Clostridiales bacterium]|nr:hypothetical protein [Clostridiales bacterium]